MFKKYLITILLVGVVILSSCKSTASSTEEDTTTEVITTLAGTHWKLQSINGVNLLPNSYISLYFRDQRIFGYADVNQYEGKYTEEPDGKLNISDTMFTLLLGQSKQINDQEKLYKQAFGEIASYIFKDHKLTINDASGQALLVFIKLPEYPADPAQLINTKWKSVSVGGQSLEKKFQTILNIDEKMTISGMDGPFYFEDTFQAKDGNLTGTGQMAKRVSDTTTSDEQQSFKVTGALSYVANYRLINGQLQLFSMRGDADTIILVPSK
jgi:heat shock protein HslJ